MLAHHCWVLLLGTYLRWLLYGSTNGAAHHRINV
jgi:hypothetical protein